MGSGIEKSSAKNPLGYRNPGEKYYNFNHFIFIIYLEIWTMKMFI